MCMLICGEVDEKDLENIEETNVIINMEKVRILGFSGKNDVKYADVASGGAVITMLVRVGGFTMGLIIYNLWCS